MKLPKPYAKDNKTLRVIIETPCGSRNKYAYDEETKLFKLKKVIPGGMEFPCDMGFLPRTKGEDGDPLDALVLMDDITYPGCLIECRLLGVITAEQKDAKAKAIRNDRYIFVPEEMKEYDHIKKIKDINKNKIDALISFFENYNKKENKKFKLLKILDSQSAHDMLKKYRN
jgi:inorganic pyrophosphatase